MLGSRRRYPNPRPFSCLGTPRDRLSEQKWELADSVDEGMTEDEMVGWHHRLDGYEFEQAVGVGDGQGGLACCGPWGRKESDATEQLT